MLKSFSEQLEEQLEPRPVYRGCEIPGHDDNCCCRVGTTPWDHSDSHEQIHEQTQD